ncbi:nucleotide-diphospho-sugar transferase [Chryseobacterium sp. RP-3-3]|uniref:Nucleotide-diphospho-sugar transferase n=1 Tax=Chryseobacterium antibioticum TaxID=2728847 RepID=A0A7Y0FR52_9FLAO|nr:sugar phosphate nucleotidyltransferase [Chryseobacterium antibioticum]NML69074.1 nucleotide-diphospho-sugar transferase [Chryseobacterium antibioticum]
MNTNHHPTLIVLAAGMGSRYGSLKQIDTFTPQGDTIIDFSLYDALQAGFKKFVFIIRKNFEKEFKEIFEKKLKRKAEIEYVFQEIDTVPAKYLNTERAKPWGTGHALLLTKDVVHENFAIINADDFYGRDAFMVMYDFLKETDINSYNFSMIGYLLKNTVSDHGYVSRGVCDVDFNGNLLNVTERTHIEKNKNELRYKEEDETFTTIEGDVTVSMNFWGFTPKCFELVDDSFRRFLEKNKGSLKAEYYLPTLVADSIGSRKANVKLLKSNDKWFGVTYPEDKKIVQKAISELRMKKLYPENLWE